MSLSMIPLSKALCPDFGEDYLRAKHYDAFFYKREQDAIADGEKREAGANASNRGKDAVFEKCDKNYSSDSSSTAQ